MPIVSRPDESPHTGQTFLYFGSLTLFIYLATPDRSLMDIQTSFMLKNQLNATATQTSLFRLITGIPIYLAFVCGMVRDQWNPLGLRDRGFFFIFAPATAAIYICMGFSGLSYPVLFIGMLLAMVVSRFTLAAYQGLIALVGQERLMSGRLSVLWNVVIQLLATAGYFASAYISMHSKSLTPRATFLLVAAAMCCLAFLGLWKPRSVFSNAYNQPQAIGTNFLGDISRLVKHRAIYPAVLICFLWNFAPGFATPLQYYLTTLGASDAVFSYFNGAFTAAFIPTFLLYGFLCRRVSLNKLLWISTIIAVPQLVPMAFLHSANGAIALAVPMGLLGGLAQAAYIDLAMRSCPPGLQGTLMMLVDGVYALSARGGDVLGSAIYGSSPTHGFLLCVIATTAVYALILPLILLVPKRLIATADGQADLDVGFEVVLKDTATEPV